MSARPHLRIVHEMTDEDRRVSASNATWKFELLETVNGDPLTDPFCLAVITAYSHFCGARDRSAFLSEIDLQVRTGGLQPRSIRKAKDRLVALGYLTPIGKTAAGIVIYRLANSRQQMIADHRLFAAEKLKEDDTFRREEERRRRKMRGSRCAPPNEAEGGADVHPTGGADMHPNTVENSVEEYLYERGDDSPVEAGSGFRDGWTIPDGWPSLQRDEVTREG